MKNLKIDVLKGHLNDLIKKKDYDLYIINVFKEDKLLPILEKFKGIIPGFESLKFDVFEKSISFKKSIAETYYIPTLEGPHLLLVGQGNKSDFHSMNQNNGFYKRDPFIIENYKKMSVKIWDYILKYKRKHVITIYHGINMAFQPIRNFIEGIYVGNYDFKVLKGEKSNYKSNEEECKPKIEFIDIFFCKDLENPVFDEDSHKVGEEINLGTYIGKFSHFVRDLINYPANYCTPSFFVDHVKKKIEEEKIYHIKLEAWDREKIEKENMASFLSVTNGSVREPKFLILHYSPPKKNTSEVLGLIGKGITFDTGGISLKPAENMHEMKGDMSGAAVVAGSILAIAKANIPLEVKVYIPLCENMPSGSATTPGNVVKARNGISIEILNTDAEGRLILADAISYASEKAEGITQIIDVATLTGAMVVALGEITTGVLGNHKGFIHQFVEIARLTGERVWELPLFPKYDLQIKSDIADIANIGKRSAGGITAAAFLKNFVGKDIPWLHLDIAGPSWSDGSSDDIYPKGGTAIMLSSIVLWAKFLASGSFKKS